MYYSTGRQFLSKARFGPPGVTVGNNSGTKVGWYLLRVGKNPAKDHLRDQGASQSARQDPTHPFRRLSTSREKPGASRVEYTQYSVFLEVILLIPGHSGTCREIK